MLRRMLLCSVWMMFLVAVFLGTTNAQAKSPRYGNFCGAGHGNSSPKQPIDQLDQACKQHDLCCKGGIKKAGVVVCPCQCDRAFLGSVNAFLSTPKGRKAGKARRAALFAKGFYNVHACFCEGKACKYKIRCTMKKKCVKLKKKRCVKVPSCGIDKQCGPGKTPGLVGKCLRCKTKKICKRFAGKNFCFTMPVCERK